MLQRSPSEGPAHVPQERGVPPRVPWKMLRRRGKHHMLLGLSGGVGVQSAPAEAWRRLRLAQPPGLLRCSHALVPSSFWNQGMFFLLGWENSSKGVRQNSSEECGEGEAAHLPMFI